MAMASSPMKTRSKGKTSVAMLPDHSPTKPKATSFWNSKKRKTCLLEDECPDVYANAELGGKDEKPNQRRKTQKEPEEEKRLRRFRKQAPTSYLERLERVRTQRMFLINRERKISEDGLREIEVFDLAGSTGNIYQITIDLVPSCNCPDCRKGNQCKHILYIMINVLKAPSNLAYQLALLSTELETIFANAPTTPQSSSEGSSTSSSTDGNRKPIEGDCPVCVMEMEEGEDIVWCKAACGNNIHRQCQQQWAASKPGQAKCVYCRTPWQEDIVDEASLKRLMESGAAANSTVNADGYVNVAAQLGISGVRDTSTYYHGPGRYFYGRYH